jgi:hypothetical protein
MLVHDPAQSSRKAKGRVLADRSRELWKNPKMEIQTVPSALQRFGPDPRGMRVNGCGEANPLYSYTLSLVYYWIFRLVWSTDCVIITQSRLKVSWLISLPASWTQLKSRNKLVNVGNIGSHQTRVHDVADRDPNDGHPDFWFRQAVWGTRGTTPL